MGDHDVKHTYMATRLEDGHSEWIVTCDCSKTFSYTHRDAAEHQHAQHRKVAELRAQMEGDG